MEKWNQTRQPGGVGRLILRFEDWSVSAAHDALGYQLDNETRELTLLGDLPQGWTWDVLVQAQGKTDIWPLALTDEGAKFTLTDENLSIKGPYCLQVRGTKGSQVRHCNAVTVYVLRTLAGTVTWPTLPTEFAQAEKNIKELNAHPPIPGENGFWLLWDLETSAYIESQLSVPVGPAGPANTLQIGTVETLEPGQAATAQITGEAPDQTLSLGIPQGQTGKTGATPALEIGQVETLEPGQPATAEFSGTPEKPVLSLGIPQGQPGKDGPANTLQIGTVETLEPGQAATAQITGEAPNQTLSLGIPRGQTGKTGATPALEIGQVETLEPGQPATAEFSGTPEKPVLSLGIPRGEPGQDGVQLNDSAINTTEAWSSKKIVDTLCPAFTVEGNPVTCQPVEGYPLGVKVSFSPRQEGEGDPSPENVRPISGYDEITVNVRGKNLLGGECLSAASIYDHNRPSLTNSYGTTISSLDGNDPPIHVEQSQLGNPSNLTSYSNGFFIIKTPQEIPDDTQLTVSMKIRVTSALSQEADAFSVLVMGTKTLPELPVNPTIQESQTLTFTFKISDGKEVAPQNRLKQVEIRIAGMSFDILEVQLELGSTPTPYEPYQPGTTSTLTLPETIYGGTVDAVTGVGSKTWGYIASYNGESLPGEWISDRDVYASGTTPTTGAQVAYKLATPEPFQATGNQALPAVAGLNTVYTDGDSLTVTGRRDLVSALEDLQTTMTAVTTLISEGGLT